MKIAVVTPVFAISGVPLAQVRFARALASYGHSVDLIVGYVHPEYGFDPPPGIKTIVLNCSNVRSMFWPLMKYLRNKEPDVVFSAEDHLNIVLLIAACLTGSRARFSGSSRVTPFDTYSNVPFRKGWILKQLARAFMWRANALTCVSEEMVKQYREVFSNPPHVSVYNIVDDRHSRQRMLEQLDHPWVRHKEFPLVVAAGRLAPWKGFGDLIDAVAALHKRRPVRLLLLGDGPLRSELQSQISRLDLIDYVQLVGYVKNPLKYYRNADLFALSSLVEGMPNVLVEAMMCGCTPVSTNCPTGPRELLQDGKYGYLVPIRNPEAMAAAIEHALDNPVSKSLLAEAVRPFEQHSVIQRHFEILGLPAQTLRYASHENRT